MPHAFLWQIYRRSLEAYCVRRGASPTYCRAYEAAIRWLAMLLTRLHGFSFPHRATGGWWWIWRWRFEVLMGWYEHECLDLCRRSISSGATVLDIGGHIGLYSRLFSRLVGPRGRVFVFEANPENVEILRRNLDRKKYRNVEVVWAAVSAKPGTATLYVSPGHSNHSLLPGYTQATATITVPVTSIDYFLSSRKIGRVDFIKSDTEGAEPLVVEGMKTTIAACPGLKMLLEYNPAAMLCGGGRPERLIEMVESLGFQVDAVKQDGTLGAIPPLKDNEYANLFCVSQPL